MRSHWVNIWKPVSSVQNQEFTFSAPSNGRRIGVCLLSASRSGQCANRRRAFTTLPIDEKMSLFGKISRSEYTQFRFGFEWSNAADGGIIVCMNETFK